MADSKISALPASTTPLAGTEVLPIVQSSTTKKVAVSDLTAGRAVSASTLSLTSSGPVSVFNTGNTSSVRQQYTNSGGTFQVGLDSSGGAIFGVPYAAVVWHGANYPIVFAVNNAEVARFNTSSNLAFATAGKGIDFSANTHAAGMTSELLNWYEEGTWTGTLVVKGSGTAGTYTPTAASTFATYTRVGRVVTLQLQIGGFDAASGGTGDLIVTGLPFTKAANSGYTATVWLFNATFPASTAGVIGRPSTSAGTSSTMEFYALVSGGGTTIPISAVGTSTQLSFNVSYIV